MNTECVVPEWLHDTFLGYGDADAAQYSQMPNQITALDFKDTFLSLDHLRDSFPKYSIKVRAKISVLVHCISFIPPPSLTSSVPLRILNARCLHSSQLVIIISDTVDQTLSPSFLLHIGWFSPPLPRLGRSGRFRQKTRKERSLTQRPHLPYKWSRMYYQIVVHIRTTNLRSKRL